MDATTTTIVGAFVDFHWADDDAAVREYASR